MTRSRWLTPRRLKAVFWLCLLLIGALLFYRVWLMLFERDFAGVHARNIEAIQRAAQQAPDERPLRFAVVGNISNSVGIFERQMIPMINAAAPDFVVSVGNAVSGGGEDKYRALNRTLGRLDMPYLLTVGENESSLLGAMHFQNHYGPRFYAFRAGSAQFIFLDSTDPESFHFQTLWLRETLQETDPTHRFAFISEPLTQVEDLSVLEFDRETSVTQAFHSEITGLFSRHGVRAVFSGDLHLFDVQRHGGADYVITGGGGGLVMHDADSDYHFTLVTAGAGGAESATESGLEIEQRPLGTDLNPVLRTVESVWFWIHSLFYVGHVNFLIGVALLIALASRLYSAVFVEKDYYPDFDLDPQPWLDRKLNVAMATNNYLPFIGGVPLSIDRLRRGLRELGDAVLVLAPVYRDDPDPEHNDRDTVRIPTLMSFGSAGAFPIVNLLSPRIGRALKRFAPDLMHIHHPFWMGWIALLWARRLGIPAVYTYHTRLEHYAHQVPLPGPLFRNLVAHSLTRRFANRCTAVVVPTESAEEYLRLIGVTTTIHVQPTGIDFERYRHTDPARAQQLRRHFGIDEAGEDDGNGTDTSGARASARAVAAGQAVRTETAARSAGRMKVLVSVSRLSREKNIDFLLDGLERLQQNCAVPWRCLIIGDGEERERLQGRIDRAGLGDRIMLVGAVKPDAIADYYRLGDLFLFASRSETQGMVILEAMAAGLPVVAIRSSGIDDVVRHGITGFKTRTDLEQWSGCVGRLLEDDAERGRMSTAAVDFARDFAIDRFASRLRNVYALTLAQWQSRGQSRGPSREQSGNVRSGAGHSTD